MVSRFETFFKSHALPVLQREFNRTVDFINTDDEELQVPCFVDTETIPSGEGFSDVQGRIGISSTVFNARIGSTIGQWTRVRIRNEIWDVYTKQTDEYGTVILNVRRKYEEQPHSNLYDLHGNQIPFAPE